MADLWTFAPQFLKQAAQTNDHLERMKLVIAFVFSSIYMCTSQDKPFNPLLGETLQGEFHDGTKFYCEHTSHHPPITNFLIEDVDGLYTMSGYYEITGKMEMNALISGLRGPNELRFKDGHHIRFGYPSYRLGGTISGARSVELIGSCTFEDLTNNRRAVVLMNTYKAGYFGGYQGRKDEVEGVIYETSQIKSDPKTIKTTYGKDIKFVTDIKNPADCKREICKIKGSWLRDLQFDDRVYWSIQKDKPVRFMHQQGDHILPSDCRFREDLIWLKYNYMQIAHQWKIRLEVQQRLDRKNRNDAKAGKAIKRTYSQPSSSPIRPKQP